MVKVRTIICFGDRSSSTFLIVVSVSQDEDNSVSQTDNFVNVLNSHYMYISLCTLLPLRFALFLNNASGLEL